MNKDKKKLCIGIDVSKDKLDIFYQKKSYVIKNNSKSIALFINSITKENLSIFCVMESTGGYEKLAFRLLHNAGITVKIAHPNKVHAFAKASGHFAKTDKLDAIAIYRYAEFIAKDASGDEPLSELQDDLTELRKTAIHIEEKLHATKCRAKQLGKLSQKFLSADIKLYQKQLIEIYELIDQKIDSDDQFRKSKEKMTSFKGVGSKTANILLIDIPELGSLNRKEIASLLGVAPRTYQSGKSERKGKIHGGRFAARRALYMAALVASRYDEYCKKRYKELLEKGKQKKVALVAIMRKLIIALNSCLKDTKKTDFVLDF